MYSKDIPAKNQLDALNTFGDTPSVLQKFKTTKMRSLLFISLQKKGSTAEKSSHLNSYKMYHCVSIFKLL